MIEDGTYAAVVVPIQKPGGVLNYCEFGESAKKKTPLVSVMFEVIRGPASGERVKWQGYFTDNDEATDRTIQSLRACGFTGDDLAAFIEQIVEQEVQIVVENEEYKGRHYPKVQWVNAVNTGVKVENQMKDSELRKFAARFKSKVKAAAPITGVRAVREAPAPIVPASDDDGGGGYQSRPSDGAPPASDDDIPF